MLNLSESSLEQVIQEIKTYQGNSGELLMLRPMKFLLWPEYARAARRLLEPWRGESRRKYLAKRRGY